MFATKLAILGTVSFLIAVAAVVYLVSSLVFTDLLAVVATVVLATTASWAWFYVPLVTFDKDDDQSPHKRGRFPAGVDG